MFNHLSIPASMLSDAQELLGNTNSDFGLTPQLATAVAEILPDYHACMLREDRRNLLKAVFQENAPDKADETMFRNFCEAVEYSVKKGSIDERVMAKAKGTESQAKKSGLSIVSKDDVNSDNTSTMRSRQFGPRSTASDKNKAASNYKSSSGLAGKESARSAAKAASRKTNTGGYPNNHPTTTESVDNSDEGRELMDLINSLSEAERIECINSLSEEQLLTLDSILNGNDTDEENAQ